MDWKEERVLLARGIKKLLNDADSLDNFTRALNLMLCLVDGVIMNDGERRRRYKKENDDVDADRA